MNEALKTICKKPIRKLTNKEILLEMESILGCSGVSFPKEKLGWISEDGSEYCVDGVVDNKKLYNLYNDENIVKDYSIVLSITSLRRRPKDLFTIIDLVKRGRVVLDYGCGVSNTGLMCARKGAKVHITDISDRMLLLAETRFKNRGLPVIAHKIDGDFPDLQTGLYDFIFCTDVAEHVPDPVALINNFSKWLKPGGVVYVYSSTMKNLKKGHLPQSINLWKSKCVKLLNEVFKRKTKNSYKLKIKAKKG